MSMTYFYAREAEAELKNFKQVRHMPNHTRDPRFDRSAPLAAWHAATATAASPRSPDSARLRSLGGWGSPGESLIGTLWETVHGKRNELVCCSRVTTPAEDLHTILYGGPASRRLIRAGQKFYMSERCGWIQGAGSLLILGSTCIGMSRSPGCL